MTAERARTLNMVLPLYSGNQYTAVNYVKQSGNYDLITLFAMRRHVHKYLMNNNGYKTNGAGRAYLIYDTYDTIILGKNNPAKSEFDAFLQTCIVKTNKRFVCSINDHSGLIVRNRDETKKLS